MKFYFHIHSFVVAVFLQWNIDAQDSYIVNFELWSDFVGRNSRLDYAAESRVVVHVSNRLDRSPISYKEEHVNGTRNALEE